MQKRFDLASGTANAIYSKNMEVQKPTDRIRVNEIRKEK